MATTSHQSSSFTYALANFTDDEYLVNLIVNAFYEKARQIARFSVRSDLRHLMPSDYVANISLHATLDSISKRDLANPSAQDFENILRDVIHKMVASRVRRLFAKKRSASRSVPFSSSIDIPVLDNAHASIFGAELCAIVVRRLYQQHGKGLRFRLAVLGILLFMDAESIRSRLQSYYPEERIPLAQNIRCKLREDKQVLREFLLEKWEMHDD